MAAILAVPAMFREPVRASYYSSKFQGRLMANGQPFDNEKLIAASLDVPLGTRLRLTNIRNGKSVEVLVLDRGPYVTKFKLDISQAAAKRLGITEREGWAWVKVEVLSVHHSTQPVKPGNHTGNVRGSH